MQAEGRLTGPLEVLLEERTEATRRRGGGGAEDKCDAPGDDRHADFNQLVT